MQKKVACILLIVTLFINGIRLMNFSTSGSKENTDELTTGSLHHVTADYTPAPDSTHFSFELSLKEHKEKQQNVSKSASNTNITDPTVEEPSESQIIAKSSNIPKFINSTTEPNLIKHNKNPLEVSKTLPNNSETSLTTPNGEAKASECLPQTDDNIEEHTSIESAASEINEIWVAPDFTDLQSSASPESAESQTFSESVTGPHAIFLSEPYPENTEGKLKINSRTTVISSESNQGQSSRKSIDLRMIHESKIEQDSADSPIVSSSVNIQETRTQELLEPSIESPVSDTIANSNSEPDLMDSTNYEEKLQPENTSDIQKLTIPESAESQKNMQLIPVSYSILLPTESSFDSAIETTQEDLTVPANTNDVQEQKSLEPTESVLEFTTARGSTFSPIDSFSENSKEIPQKSELEAQTSLEPKLASNPDESEDITQEPEDLESYSTNIEKIPQEREKNQQTSQRIETKSYSDNIKKILQASESKKQTVLEYLEPQTTSTSTIAAVYNIESTNSSSTPKSSLNEDLVTNTTTSGTKQAHPSLWEGSDYLSSIPKKNISDTENYISSNNSTVLPQNTPQQSNQSNFSNLHNELHTTTLRTTVTDNLVKETKASELSQSDHALSPENKTNMYTDILTDTTTSATNKMSSLQAGEFNLSENSNSSTASSTDKQKESKEDTKSWLDGFDYISKLRRKASSAFKKYFFK